MSRAVITAIEIHDARLYLPGGDVYDWCWEIASDLERRARLFAPPNRTRSRYAARRSTGAMAKTIKSGVWNMTDDSIMVDLSVGTDYAPYVLGGTAAQGTQYIYSNTGWANKVLIDRVMRRIEWRRQTWEENLVPSGSWMVLRGPSPIRSRRNYQLRVRGQRANPFLTDAYTVTRREHRSLPRLAGVPDVVST